MKPLFQTIVVAVSGSEQSLNAARYGIALAKSSRGRLIAVYVVDTATLKELLMSRIFVEDESEEYRKGLERNGERYLSYVAELAQKKGVAVEKSLRHGSVSSEILQVSDESKANVILLGAFAGQTSLRDVLGRQHREILRNAKCSVLVVKEPDIESLFRSI
jgi:nucleotide-binding universal stress UspA family protein